MVLFSGFISLILGVKFPNIGKIDQMETINIKNNTQIMGQILKNLFIYTLFGSKSHMWMPLRSPRHEESQINEYRQNKTELRRSRNL